MKTPNIIGASHLQSGRQDDIWNVNHLASVHIPSKWLKKTQEQGGGVFPEKLGGVCGPFPKTLTLFMTKIYNLCYPNYDLAKNPIPCLWPLLLAQLP